MPTTTGEEAIDDDHETLDQVSTELCRSTKTRSAPKWYGNPILEVMLLDHGEPTNYEEAMMSPDSDRWLEAMNLRWDSYMRTKCGILWTCPMIGNP